jgi:hypothetical protein
LPSKIEFGPGPNLSKVGFGPAPTFSKIEFGPGPNLSRIGFGPAPNLSRIEFGPAPAFSKIEFGPAPNLSTIEFGPAPNLSKIQFGPAPTFSEIQFGPAPQVTGTFIWSDPPAARGSFTWGTPPQVSINWGTPPTLSCTVTVSCDSSQGGAGFARKTLGDDFVDDFNTQDFDIEISDLGIPSEIKVVAPKFPDIRVKHDIPEFINVVSDVPDKIVIYQADVLPGEIKIVSEDVPKSIFLDAREVPKSIKIDAGDVPRTIRLLNVDVPSVIRVDGSEIPDVIKVVGIPDVIEVKMPSEIVAKLEVPENLEIPLVYKGGPVPIQFDTSNLLEGEERACFALVPCNKK